MAKALIPIALLFAGVLAGAGCSADSQGDELPTRSSTVFQTEVYPVLARDCGFHGCHGAPERFFRVWGPGRQRMDPTTRAFAQMSGMELATNLSVALSMIDTENPSRSLLLRKPLAVEAGGSGHLGVDKYGRNVYRSVNDAGYVVIANWVNSMAMTVPPQQPMTPPPTVPAQ
jgi:hypothetical protein